MNHNSKTEAKRSGLSHCLNCDYKDGFHIAFKPGEKSATELVFICPSCHSRFNTGWIIDKTN